VDGGKSEDKERKDEEKQEQRSEGQDAEDQLNWKHPFLSLMNPLER
jgi:hypothetical protein